MLSRSALQQWSGRVRSCFWHMFLSLYIISILTLFIVLQFPYGRLSLSWYQVYASCFSSFFSVLGGVLNYKYCVWFTSLEHTRVKRIMAAMAMLIHMNVITVIAWSSVHHMLFDTWQVEYVLTSRTYRFYATGGCVVALIFYCISSIPLVEQFAYAKHANGGQQLGSINHDDMDRDNNHKDDDESYRDDDDDDEQQQQHEHEHQQQQQHNHDDDDEADEQHDDVTNDDILINTHYHDNVQLLNNSDSNNNYHPMKHLNIFKRDSYLT